LGTGIADRPASRPEGADEHPAELQRPVLDSASRKHSFELSQINAKTKRISEGGTCCTLTWLRDTKEQKDRRRAGKKKAATGPGTSSTIRAEIEKKQRPNGRGGGGHVT
jgi:hypothetical protein